MRVMISPNEMSGLAANASAALAILSSGESVDEDVVFGLQEGLRLCQVLTKGDEVRRSPSNFFSAEQLAESEFRDLVFDMPGGDAVTDKLDSIVPKMQSILEAAARTAVTPEIRDLAAKLSEYFDFFAIKLPFYEAIRNRMVAAKRA